MSWAFSRRQFMDMNVINERVQRGVWERWRIRSNQGAHPFHVHGCSFLIERMEGSAASPDQRGWKDMVVLDDDDWSEIVVRFDHPATERYPYMYHCHILEHEDRGMMGQFTVVDPTWASTAIRRREKSNDRDTCVCAEHPEPPSVPAARDAPTRHYPRSRSTSSGWSPGTTLPYTLATFPRGRSGS